MEISEIQAAVGANPQQLEAIQTIEGPVLVVAGPGTGKTQLLSLRAAYILATTNVDPQNILCLTFTNAATEAMRQRLADLLGAPAYQIEVSTFHAFAEHQKTLWPEYFQRWSSDQLISELQRSKLISHLLDTVPIRNSLYGRGYTGNPDYLREISSFFQEMKSSGLAVGDLRAIAQQNLDFLTYLEEQSDLLGQMDFPLRGRAALEWIDQIIQTVPTLVAAAPVELRLPVAPGLDIYEPYAHYLERLFTETPLYDPESHPPKFSGFSALRDTLREKDDNNTFRYRDRGRNERLLTALDLYERYIQTLADGHFYEYEEQISALIAALQEYPSFKYTLQDRYKYIMVDEFQDTNGSQMRLLNLLGDSSEAPNILAVGDDDQAIMRFQGAMIQNILQFGQRYPSLRQITLANNYRSGPALVSLGTALARQIEQRLPGPKQLISQRQTDPRDSITGWHYASRELEYQAIASDIQRRVAAGYMQSSQHPSEAIAVIARDHQSLKNLIPYLNDLDVAFNYRIQSSVANLETLATYLATLHCLAALSGGRQRQAESFLPQILAAPEFGVEAADFISFAVEARRRQQDWWPALAASQLPGLQGIYQQLLEWAALSATWPLRSLLAKVAEPLQDYYRQRQDADPLQLLEFNAGLLALRGFVEAELANQAGLASLAGTGGEPPIYGRRLELADVMQLLDDAWRFGVDINVDLTLSRPEAVTLTTAHSAKGLQFDLVYIIDAEDKVWHKNRRANRLLSNNLQFGQPADDDDDRRLLFVAATRARYENYFSIGGGQPLRELVDLVDFTPVEADLASLTEQTDAAVLDRYYPSDISLTELIQPLLDDKKISASLLNQFVEYSAIADQALGFYHQQILKLPGPPVDALDFGTIVHDFLKDWVQLVWLHPSGQLPELVQKYQQRLAWLDFNQETIQALQQRLDQIVEVALPLLAQIVTPGAKSECWGNAVVDGVPLTGKFDLLLPDDSSHQLLIYDFKTGKNASDGQPTSAQQRQLLFYKLLLENSADFGHYQVTGAADFYLEATTGPDQELPEPLLLQPNAQELAHLRQLIQVVWWRLRRLDLDVSAFETSELLAELRAQTIYKSAGVGHEAGAPKEPSLAEKQPVFEQWLIQDWQARSSAG
ncbi:MAG: ATP-dependent helicase [Actinomycetia bacterium]|nr:ATP-dependent helicase [Actinomycetes bacterium]